MYYTKYLLLLVIFVLSGCAGSPAEDTDQTMSEEIAGQITAVEDITLYREAITHLNNNELTEAEKLFLAIAIKHPELAGPWANLGLIHIKNNDLAKAGEYLEKAIAKNPRLPQALNFLGFVAEKNGDIIKAKNYYLQAIAAKDKYANAHYNLALLYDIYFQDIPNSIKYYKQYLQYIDTEDKPTTDWVQQLENAYARGKP